MIDQDKLNQINLGNASTPGKIAQVYDKVSKTNYFIFEPSQFDPTIQDLLITQIWTKQQEELVNSKLAYLKEQIRVFEVSSADVDELVRLYEMLTEWLYNTLDYAVTTSD